MCVPAAAADDDDDDDDDPNCVVADFKRTRVGPGVTGFVLVISWTSDPTEGVDVKVVTACLICSMLKQNLKKSLNTESSRHRWSTCLLWIVLFLISVLFLLHWDVLTQQNLALIGFLFSWELREMEKKINIYLKKTKYLLKKKKKEACMFSTVCTRYIHVALAAYVPMLWERFTFGHSCNYSVVLSKNVSTWNKKHLVIFLLYSLRKRSLVLVSFSHELPWEMSFFPRHVRTVTSVWSFWICRISLFAWKSCLVSVSFSLLLLRFNMVPFVEKMGTEQTVGNKEKISEVLEWFSENEPLGLNSN